MPFPLARCRGSLGRAHTGIFALWRGRVSSGVIRDRRGFDAMGPCPRGPAIRVLVSDVTDQRRILAPRDSMNWRKTYRCQSVFPLSLWKLTARDPCRMGLNPEREGLLRALAKLDFNAFEIAAISDFATVKMDAFDHQSTFENLA